MSSKSSEWPSAPLSSAATAGVQVLLSPNTVESPLPSSASASSILSSEGVDSASRRARMALPRKSSVSTLARSSTSRRDVLEFQVGDIGGERCGFVGHRVSSFWAQGRRADFAFKPAADDGQQLCSMSFTSIRGLAATSRNRTNDRFAKTPVRPAAVPQDADWRWRSGSRWRPSVAFAIATALHLMLPLWAVLTSLIVTQMSVGRSLKVTRDYMFGTIGGAIYGGAIAVLIPHSGEAGLLALLVLAVAPLALHRSDQSEPEHGHRDRGDRAAGPDHEPRQRRSVRRSIASSRSPSARSPGFWCRSWCCRRGRTARSASTRRGRSN